MWVCELSRLHIIDFILVAHLNEGMFRTIYKLG